MMVIRNNKNFVIIQIQFYFQIFFFKIKILKRRKTSEEKKGTKTIIRLGELLKDLKFKIKKI